MKVTRLKKIVSYIVPVKIWSGFGAGGGKLELFLSYGNWQLSTDDAIYSDGFRYRPLLSAFKKIKGKLPLIEKVLFLGSGIGSGVMILNNMGFSPEFVLVDSDKKILELAKETLPSQHISFVHKDANEYMLLCKDRFDIIAIDIFSGRIVPEFVSTETFINKCKNSLATEGTIIINYMLNTDEDRSRFSYLQSLFLHSEVIDIGINKVLLANC